MTMSDLSRLVGEDALKAMQADPVAFITAFDQPPWEFQAQILRQVAERNEAGKFVHRIAVVSLPRQNGKSTLGAWLALWRLYCDPLEQEIVSVALDRDGARIILGDARRIVRNSNILYSLLDDNGLTRSEIRLRDGGRWMIRSSDAVYSRGLRPSTVVYDELGWTSDAGELFQVLSAAQATQVNPLILVTSTVGPVKAGPLWELFEAARHGDLGIMLFHATENRSPLVSEEFLEHQRALLPASVFAREHQNLWGEGSDVFATDNDWRRATQDGDPRRASDPGPSYAFCDLGWSHDETAIAVVKQAPDGKDEVIWLEAFRGSKTNPVDLNAVGDRVAELHLRYGITKAAIESPQGVGMAQGLTRRGFNVDITYPTMRSNTDRWGALYGALKAGTLRLPNDAKLRRQLLTLTIKAGVSGWRVEDVPSIHQDRAVAVAAALFLARQPVTWLIS
jgi:hypothetical protein